MPTKNWVQSGDCALSLGHIGDGYASSDVTLKLTNAMPSTTTNCIRLVHVKVVVDRSTYVNFNTKYHNGRK